MTVDQLRTTLDEGHQHELLSLMQQVSAAHGGDFLVNLLKALLPSGSEITDFSRLQPTLAATCLEAGHPYQLLVQADPAAKNPAGRLDLHCYPGRGVITKPGR